MAKKKINPKNLYVAAGILVLLVIYLSLFDRSIEEKSKNKNKLFKYTLADVNKFEIQKENSVITVERKMNNWQITKPRTLRASGSDVEIYLQDVKDLEVKKKLGKDIPDLTPYGLNSPKYVLKFWLGTGKNQKLLVLKVGNQNPDKSGYYAKFENRPEVVLLDIIAESTIDKNLLYFRYKDIVDADVDSIEKFTVKFNNESYMFQKKNNVWSLISPIVWDNLSDSDSVKFLAAIKDLKVKTYYDDKETVSAADAGVLNPSMQISLIDKTQKIYNINIGKEVKGKSEYYGRNDNNGIIFGVDKSIIDNLQKDLVKLKNELMDKKKKAEEAKRKKEEAKKKKLKQESKKNEKE